MSVTVQEFGTIAAAIKAAWPNANIMPDNKSKDIWYTMLHDIEYPICLNAIKQLMSTSKFAPSIAEIRERCAGVCHETRDWGAAWDEVLRAIRFHGMYQEQEALLSMSEDTRICVRRIGFQNICLSENITADRANFRMIYEAMTKDKKEMLQLPENVRRDQERIRLIAADTVRQLEAKQEAE